MADGKLAMAPIPEDGRGEQITDNQFAKSFEANRNFNFDKKFSFGIKKNIQEKRNNFLIKTQQITFIVISRKELFSDSLVYDFSAN